MKQIKLNKGMCGRSNGYKCNIQVYNKNSNNNVIIKIATDN